MRTPPIPQLVLYTLTVVIVVALVVAASTTTAAFGAYNVEWDGTSDFRELTDQETESLIALETAAYESVSANETVAVALAPAATYGENDSRRVRAFLKTGGTLVVADDIGPHGNRLLADIGATARFDGAQLRDERSYYRAPSLPVATEVRETPYTVGVERLTLNGATAIEPVPASENSTASENATVSGNSTRSMNETVGNVTVVATTSAFGYLDRNATGDLSTDDELGAYPVVTVESVGEGRVIAVSDPSLFINAMLTEPDNAAFATALVNSADRVLLDYSHSGDQPPLAVALLGFRSSSPLQIAVGVVGVGAVWWYGYRGPGSAHSVRHKLSRRLPRRWRRRLPAWLLGSGPESDEPPVDEAAVLDALRRRYPGWEESRLRSAMTDVLPDRGRRKGDE